ncbi:MAG: hypothetical protein VZR56_01295 [Treponema sp.]|nr:hypothetical protein [Treponema sp.]
MSDISFDIFSGRKTFFIAPDISLLPETYMEEYLSHGYETYIICDDRYCSLKKKVELIINLFRDSILFFYIDAAIEGIEWQKYIYHLQRDYGDKVLIGVLYSKGHTDEEREKLEKYYLFDVGVQCGCIGLEYQHTKNFALIDKVMYANQAGGRRKTVRAICDDTSEVSFMHEDESYSAKITDISLNHFSCVMKKSSKPLPIYTKISDMLLIVNGLHFQTDGILLMERVTDDGPLYIFVFTRIDGSQGLESDTAHRLSQKIYKIVTTKAKDIMASAFESAGRGQDIESISKAFANKV